MALCCRLPHGRLYFDIPADDFWRDEPATFLEMIAPPPLTAVLAARACRAAEAAREGT